MLPRKWVCENCCTPQPPELPAAKRVNFAQAVSRWFKQKFSTEDLSEDNIWADNAPERPVKFDPTNHRKYNSQVYFRKDPAQGAHNAQERWQMSDPPRSAIAQRAYDDFLLGLQAIGSQELLIGTHGTGTVAHTGSAMPEPDQRAILRELMPGLSEDDCRGAAARDNLHSLAEWERFVQLRENAATRRGWYLNLKRRAGTGRKDFNKHHTVGKLHLPPIRRSTFSLLVRRTEMDFDPSKYFMRLFSMIIMMVSLFSQAPPLAFRETGGFLSTQHDYFHTVKETCLYGSRGCVKPGYRIQWPYMETTVSGGGSNVSFPEALGKGGLCKLQQGGYMWDNFASMLRNEFWDCGHTPILAFREGNASFHWDTLYYKTAHHVTKECMEKTRSSGVSTVLAKTDWQELSVREDMEICFMHEMEKRAHVSGCKCASAEDFQEWVLGSMREEDLGKHQKFGCFFDAPNASQRYPVSYHSCTALPRSPIFKGRLAQNAENKKILEERQRSVFFGLTGRISGRKSGALIFFLVKEGGPITACVAIPVLAVVMILVFPLIRLGYFVVELFVCGGRPARVQLTLGCWVLWERLFWDIVSMAWAICYRMSSTWNCVGKFRRCFFAYQMNHCIMHDTADQITALVNICFNLVCLVYSDVKFEGASQGQTFGVISRGGWLWSAIVLSLVNISVIILMTQEKLKTVTGLMKDINENRLLKFELALGLVKVMEDFLEDDVQFNFVQHFYSDERLLPLELNSDEVEGKGRSVMRKEAETEDTEIFDDAEIAQCCCCTKFSEGQVYFPVIPQHLVDKFGHDGLFDLQGKEPSSSPLLQTQAPHNQQERYQPAPAFITQGPVFHHNSMAVRASSPSTVVKRSLVQSSLVVYHA